MKKYIAFAQPTQGGGNSVQSNSFQTSKVMTKEAATEWARNHVAKNSNMKAYVTEIFSVVTRPDPVVTVMPFTPETEELSVNHA